MADTLSTASAGPRFTFTLRCGDPAAAPEDIARLAERCAPFLTEAGASGEEANAVQIALEELLTNLAKFGADAAGPPPVLVAEGEVEIGGRELRLVLADNGLRFDPSAIAPPEVEADAASRPVGGLGLYLLFQLFDKHEYRRQDGRNINIWTMARRTGG